MLARIAGGARLQTHPDLAPYVERFANREVSHRLSTAALETLAIVAYRQPVSRGQISALRGVNVDGVTRLLEQRGYIAVVGHAEGPGQPALFGTTELFLERLGLDSLEQLPAVEDFLPGPEVAGDFERDLQSALGLGVEAAIRRRLRDPRASDSRRSWRGPGSGRDAPANSSSRGAGQRRRRGRHAWAPDRPLEGPGRARRRPGAGRSGPRLLPAQQARRRDHDCRRPPGAADRRLPGAGRAACLPGRPARSSHRGASHPHQRRSALAAADPSVDTVWPRSTSPRWPGARPHPAPCAPCARAWSSTTARPRRPRWACWRRACCAW